MSTLATDIEIFINRAQQKIATVGDTMLAKDLQGVCIDYDMSLIQELSAAVDLFQNSCCDPSENLSYKLIGYLTQKANMSVLPIAIFDNNCFADTVLLPSGGYIEGPPGPKGDSATITIGTVTGLPYGSTPTVTNSGNSSAAIFNFGIPAGENGTDGSNGDNGWSPIYALVADGLREVLELTGWTGGTGTPPTTVGVYVGPTGYVSLIGDAVDIRGPQGNDGTAGDNGLNGWTPVLSVVSDGDRRVLQVISWTGGDGTAPDSGVYVSATGFTTDIAEAIDIRGEQGAQGEPFVINADGLLSDRNLYDNEGTGFTFLATDTGDVYIKNSPIPGDWGPPISFVGDRGWSPIINTVIDGERVVLQVSDWVGGEGPKPPAGDYISTTGFTTDIAQATDIRGDRGEFFIDAASDASDRFNWDNEERPFTFYALDLGQISFKNSNATADWTTYYDWRGERGPQGPVGSAGASGSNAFTTTTGGFTMPAVAGTVNVSVADTAWMAVGQVVFIETAGYFEVNTIVSGLTVTLENLGYAGNAAPTTVITTGQKVSPAGIDSSSLGDYVPFSLTDANNDIVTNGNSFTIGDGIGNLFYNISGGVLFDNVNNASIDLFNRQLRANNEAVMVNFSTSSNGLILNNIGSANSVALKNTNVTSSRILQFPNADGTIALTADLSAYLPLSGGIMTGEITGGALGTNGLDFNYFGADVVRLHGSGSGITIEDSSQVQFNTGSIDLQTTSGVSIGSGGGFRAILSASSISGSSKTFTFPNTTGTFALTSDINSAVSGTSGQVAYFSGTNTITSEPAFSYDATNDRLGVGVSSPSARIHSLGTTEQLRLGFDAGNYFSGTINSTANATFDLTASSGTPQFTFNKQVNVATALTTSGVFTTNSGSTSSANITVSTGNTASTTTETNLLFGGASTVGGRRWMRGAANFAPSANFGYAGTIFGTEAVTIASSGTHSVFSTAVFKPLSLTTGSGTVTNTATVYIEGAASAVTGASSNHSLMVASGTSRFQGQVQISVGAATGLNIGGGTNVAFATSTGTKIGVTTNDMFAFWNATPIVQPANTVAINDVLVNTGLRASGGTSNFTSNLSSTGTVTGTQFRLSSLNTAPSSASDTGTTGEIRIDANYIYICTATNTWKRVAIATW